MYYTLPPYQFSHLVELSLVRSIFTFSGAFVSEIHKCLPEAICCYIYIVYRDFITTLIIGVLNFAVIQNVTFSGTFISQI